jgi:hypothetical protein
MSTDANPFKFAPPAIAVCMPPGWSLRESLTVTSPGGDANVIFSSERLQPPISAWDYMINGYDLLASEFSGFVSRGFEQFSIEGVTGEVYRHVFEWEPPEEGSRPVVQMQLYAVRQARGFTATATTTADRIDELGSVLVGILSSLIISEESADRIAAIEAGNVSPANEDPEPDATPETNGDD